MTYQREWKTLKGACQEMRVCFSLWVPSNNCMIMECFADLGIVPFYVVQEIEHVMAGDGAVWVHKITVPIQELDFGEFQVRDLEELVHPGILCLKGLGSSPRSNKPNDFGLWLPRVYELYNAFNCICYLFCYIFIVVCGYPDSNVIKQCPWHFRPQPTYSQSSKPNRNNLSKEKKVDLST